MLRKLPSYFQRLSAGTPYRGVRTNVLQVALKSIRQRPAAETTVEE